MWDAGCTWHSSHTCEICSLCNFRGCKSCSATPWRRMVECMYRSIFSWPRHCLEVSSQLNVPAALSPGNEPPRYPFDRRLGRPQSPSGRRGEEEVLGLYPDSSSDSSVVQKGWCIMICVYVYVGRTIAKALSCRRLTPESRPNPRALHVESVVFRAALRQTSLRVLRFLYVSFVRSWYKGPFAA
jgi:hypothetical protein